MTFRSALLLLLLAGCSGGDVLDRAMGRDVSAIRAEIATYPDEQKAAFAAVEERCAKCHSPWKPFAAHVPKGTWSYVVRTMQRKPGAAIPDDDAARIAAFFEYYAERRP